MTEERRRQHYNEEFKKETVKFIQEQTKSLGDIAEELNIPKSTLHQWLAQYREFEHEPVNNAELIRELKAQLKAKERQISEMEEELAIVKKAVHIFSNPRK
ncbi:transposase [Paenibacillus albicereus]|uniref:Transposase n=1 Tax=Paenibacillus albicereus TaxID=2726185 RepID=A0A6H2GYQ8_9BACL|nr:transposase [Paenibacillus albicereus]QJC52573.1 transposase [Paenibacillus albicereus]